MRVGSPKPKHPFLCAYDRLISSAHAARKDIAGNKDIVNYLDRISTDAMAMRDIFNFNLKNLGKLAEEEHDCPKCSGVLRVTCVDCGVEVDPSIFSNKTKGE